MRIRKLAVAALLTGALAAPIGLGTATAEAHTPGTCTTKSYAAKYHPAHEVRAHWAHSKSGRTYFVHAHWVRAHWSQARTVTTCWH